MKRSVFLFTCVFVMITSICLQPTANAQVNEAQLNQYLTSINWTTGDLIDYLSFFDYELGDFESLEELEMFLGTPITNENLNELLGKYDMTHSDLEQLLAEYGETLDDYKFIDDLDLDVQFFLGHHEEFSIANDFLSLFGLTEDEMENLFEHIGKVDKDILEQNLNPVFKGLEELSYLQGVAKLSPEEQEQLFALWEQMFVAFQLDARFYLVKDETMSPIELQSLVNRDELEGYSLFMALHNLEGDVLATLAFSEDMLASHLMYESLDQLGQISKLAGEYSEMLATAKLPITAANFIENIVLSVLIISFGVLMVVVARRRAIH
ncbi:processed acidic surface protein [Anaerobacillus sp. CMMVII]|uniref:processed acidic surface protein n=1 Tax=Anaerobacillus sp. CMMVII TaxID=2755588 RepID=UPI0021B78616|nr:processed acidic surface protein [Anaerobacillus sp. CMMVII]MCT8139464.1 processed acidic surface protein [Anaerobacillus sp. CMMVII]